MYPYPIIFGLDLYEIMILLAVITCFLLCDKMMQNRGFSIALQKMTIVAIPLCVIFGYCFAVLFQAVYNYFESGVFIISKNTGATFYGGLLGGAAVFLLFWFFAAKLFLKDKNRGEQIRKFPDILNIAACCVPLAHGIGRIGCFFAGCCHGKTTSAWYGVKMYTENGWQKVVPIQLFEAIFLILLAGILFYLFFKKPNGIPLFPLYCGVYGIWRFFIEYARADDRGATFISALSPSQLTAVCLILFACAYLLIYFLKKRKKEKNVDETHT